MNVVEQSFFLCGGVFKKDLTPSPSPKERGTRYGKRDFYFFLQHSFIVFLCLDASRGFRKIAILFPKRLGNIVGVNVYK